MDNPFLRFVKSLPKQELKYELGGTWYWRHPYLRIPVRRSGAADFEIPMNTPSRLTPTQTITVTPGAMPTKPKKLTPLEKAQKQFLDASRIVNNPCSFNATHGLWGNQAHHPKPKRVEQRWPCRATFKKIPQPHLNDHVTILEESLSR